ncbi:MAG: NTE family protein [Saprospiraceae bacterium]|jgi:NTE family protein
MKTILYLLFLTTCILYAEGGVSQSSDFHFTQRDYTKRPKVGIALSGGAAHGLAHIGVIKYLDEIGVDIDYVTGTSMGAVIGALHAMGYNGKQMEEIAAGINWDAIINNNIRYEGVSPAEKFHHDIYPLNFAINDRRILLPQGLLNTNRLELVLARLFSPTVGIDQFLDFPRPFRCYGVDIETGEVVSMENGKLTEALRASMAIPSVFSPFKYQDQWIVDGGLMRNFPVIENYNMGADIVIGSYVGREKSDISELNNLIDILSESAFMMSIQDSKKQKERSDILFCADVKTTGVFDFNSYKSLIKEGYISAKFHHQELMDLLGILNRYPKGEKKIPIEIPEYLYIDSIKTSNLPIADQKLAIDKFGYKSRTHMTYRMIEGGIARVMSTLNFEFVKYEIRKVAEKNILYINAKPREYRKVGININHFSNTNSSLILSGQARNLFFRLSNLRGTIRLSDNPGIAGEYYLRGGLNSKNWILGMRLSVVKTRLSFYSRNLQKKTGFQWEGHVKPYLMYEFSNNISVTGLVDFKRLDFQNDIRSALDIKRIVNRSTRFGLEFKYDSRDERVLPRKGALYLLSAGYGLAYDDIIKYTTEEASDVVIFPKSEDYFDAELYASRTLALESNVWWTLAVDLFYKSKPSLLDGYKVGGTSVITNLSLPFIGYVNTELMSNRHVYARTDIRFPIFEQVSLAMVFNGIYTSNNSLEYSDPGQDITYFAYGAGIELGIKSPLGPILFDIGYNSEAKKIKGEISVGWRHFF